MVSQSSSVGYTIIGKTADLTVVQKTTIETLHKEGKTQKVIAKEAVHRALCPSTLIERQRQKRLAWAKDKKDWTAAEWSKVMFSDVKFCISFGNQGPESGGREERHRIHVA
ncbi:Transposable element Tcb2 transposase [Labeo rohita]|uniref:Transposable element Tcb2 transposase n=1 Tax=Labeo rohita TaxID=84645 RepID=A0ABQ8L0P0_LABRO|nr:Transposable element Tcb2 transposase [Labeo rohita]